MRLAVPGVIVAIAACAPGCQLVFSVDPPDRVPHVPEAEEFSGTLDLTVPGGERYMLDTETLDVSGNNFQGIVPVVIKQDQALSDLTILRVRHLVIDGTLKITGQSRPFVLLAETVTINGLLDANAGRTSQGPGGGQPEEMTDPGRGRPGGSIGGVADSHSGGGGGAFASGAGDGGSVICGSARSVEGGSGGDEIADAELRVLRGGGAGGRGGSQCATMVARGGGGGGAIQLSATVSITIAVDSGILVGGGGGDGGLGTAVCPADDSGGAGGGAGGAIYLDAPEISNDGFLQAHGGGGGAGGEGVNDGEHGFDAADDLPNHSRGGVGMGKGKSGGDGGTPGAQPGQSGTCGQANLDRFNAGGGGGAPGRIVLRGVVTQLGSVSPNPKPIDRPPI